MCGRFVSPEEAAIERAVEVGRRRGLVWKPSYNMAPSMAVPAQLSSEEPSYILDSARWGFILKWWKHPHFLHEPDDGLLLFAGLYSEREDDRTGTALTVAILTCTAKGTAAAIHDRMPVILLQPAAARWVNPAKYAKQHLESVLAEHRGSAIDALPISRRVNSPRIDDPSLVEATDDAAA